MKTSEKQGKLNPSIRLIDNMHETQSMAAEIEASQIEKLRISYATTKNFVDCGIFVMRHMEMFMGNHTRAWDCGFPKDERAKKTKCILLRKKYA
ncbi:hypothetical protein R6Q59_005234 [Mikania micrantha]